MSASDSGPIWLAWARHPPRAILAAGMITVVAVGISLGLNGIQALGWHAATRVTAVLAFALWWLSFTAGPLNRLHPTPSTRALRTRRRALGLAFATTLAIHGLCILMLARLEAGILVADVAVLGGGFGYVMTAAMAATSSDVAVRRLGAKRWRALHLLGQWTLFVVFFVTYGGRFAEDAEYWPGFALVLAAGAIALAARAQSARLRSNTLPTE